MNAKKLIVVCAVLALATVSLEQGLMMQVGEASQVLTQKAVDELRDSGIIVSKQDIDRAKVIENHRQILTQKMRDLAAYENAYRQTGNTARLAQIQADIKAVRDTYSRLPVANDKQNYTKGMNAYYRDVAPIAIRRAQKINQNLAAYSSEVKPLYKDAGNRPSANTGSNIRGGQIGNNLEIYVQAFSGDATFYINGVKITRAKQTIPISGEGSMLISVKGKGKTRKMIEDFTGGPNTNIESRDEDSLTYSVSSGGFNGRTSLKVKEETADFSATKAPNMHAELHKVGNKAKITFDGAFSIGLSVTGKTIWTRSSQRPARTVNDTIIDDFKGSITIWVSGKGG